MICIKPIKEMAALSVVAQVRLLCPWVPAPHVLFERIA